MVTTVSPLSERIETRDAISIDVEKVARVFDVVDGSQVLALDSVSFSIHPSEFVSLVGPSGCGKSTLLRLIAGVDVPTTGQIFAGGRKITHADASRGLVFQDPSLFPWLSVRRNIELGLAARGMLRGHRDAVDALMHLMGLSEFEDVYPHQLSGGMAQRVALARTVVNSPALLLMDEPLGALDAFTRMRLQDEVLRLWRDRGTTMLLVTHDIDEAIYLSDRIILMSPRPGRVEQIIEVTLSRPRLRSGDEFLKLRATILEMLHLAGGDSVDRLSINRESH